MARGVYLAITFLTLFMITGCSLSLAKTGNDECVRKGCFGFKEALTLHYGSKQGEIETLNFTLSHERTDERVAQYLRLEFWLI